ncbi:hypothetical protein GOP47_0021111 [Adiantum capillus-veneris]|uniref:Uncharacterized protein n=1 Tax=Adiantum capillus-veneris TaxID=13818 RepID=A0A9D4UCA6_ADICA|nr:hypothetical protein GOP47_0021111 [Adiantum capillus-veneris]
MKGAFPSYDAMRGLSLSSIKRTRLFMPTPWVDPMDNLHSQNRELKDENTKLKAHLAVLETRLSSLESQKQADNEHLLVKAKEVEHTLIASMFNLATEVQEAIIAVSSKVDECMQELRERREQALSVQISSLPSTWWGEIDDYASTLVKLNQAIHLTKFNPNTIEKVHHDKSTNQGILVFKTKEVRIALLQQARLLKGTKVWISEALTPPNSKLRNKNSKRFKKHKQPANGPSTEATRPSSRNSRLQKLPSHLFLLPSP